MKRTKKIDTSEIIKYQNKKSKKYNHFRKHITLTNSKLIQKFEKDKIKKFGGNYKKINYNNTPFNRFKNISKLSKKSKLQEITKNISGGGLLSDYFWIKYFWLKYKTGFIPKNQYILLKYMKKCLYYFKKLDPVLDKIGDIVINLIEPKKGKLVRFRENIDTILHLYEKNFKSKDTKRGFIFKKSNKRYKVSLEKKKNKFIRKLFYESKKDMFGEKMAVSKEYRIAKDIKYYRKKEIVLNKFYAKFRNNYLKFLEGYNLDSDNKLKNLIDIDIEKGDVDVSSVISKKKIEKTKKTINDSISKNITTFLSKKSKDNNRDFTNEKDEIMNEKMKEYADTVGDLLLQCNDKIPSLKNLLYSLELLGIHRNKFSKPSIHKHILKNKLNNEERKYLSELLNKMINHIKIIDEFELEYQLDKSISPINYEVKEFNGYLNLITHYYKNITKFQYINDPTKNKINLYDNYKIFEKHKEEFRKHIPILSFSRNTNINNLNIKSINYEKLDITELKNKLTNIDILCVQNLNLNIKKTEEKQKYAYFSKTYLKDYSLVCYSRYKYNHLNLIYVKNNEFELLNNNSRIRIVNNNINKNQYDQSIYTQLTYFTNDNFDLELGNKILEVGPGDKFISRSFCMIYLTNKDIKFNPKFNVICTHLGGDSDEIKDLTGFCRYNIKNTQLQNLNEIVKFQSFPIYTNVFDILKHNEDEAKSRDERRLFLTNIYLNNMLQYVINYSEDADKFDDKLKEFLEKMKYHFDISSDYYLNYEKYNALTKTAEINDDNYEKELFNTIKNIQKEQEFHYYLDYIKNDAYNDLNDTDTLQNIMKTLKNKYFVKKNELNPLNLNLDGIDNNTLIKAYMLMPLCEMIINNVLNKETFVQKYASSIHIEEYKKKLGSIDILCAEFNSVDISNIDDRINEQFKDKVRKLCFYNNMDCNVDDENDINYKKMNLYLFHQNILSNLDINYTQRTENFDATKIKDYYLNKKITTIYNPGNIHIVYKTKELKFDSRIKLNKTNYVYVKNIQYANLFRENEPTREDNIKNYLLELYQNSRIYKGSYSLNSSYINPNYKKYSIRNRTNLEIIDFLIKDLEYQKILDIKTDIENNDFYKFNGTTPQFKKQELYLSINKINDFNSINLLLEPKISNSTIFNISFNKYISLTTQQIGGTTTINNNTNNNIQNGGKQEILNQLMIEQLSKPEIYKSLPDDKKKSYIQILNNIYILIENLTKNMKQSGIDLNELERIQIRINDVLKDFVLLSKNHTFNELIIRVCKFVKFINQKLLERDVQHINDLEILNNVKNIIVKNQTILMNELGILISRLPNNSSSKNEIEKQYRVAKTNIYNFAQILNLQIKSIGGRESQVGGALSENKTKASGYSLRVLREISKTLQTFAGQFINDSTFQTEIDMGLIDFEIKTAAVETETEVNTKYRTNIMKSYFFDDRDAAEIRKCFIDKEVSSDCIFSYLINPYPTFIESYLYFLNAGGDRKYGANLDIVKSKYDDSISTIDINHNEILSLLNKIFNINNPNLPIEIVDFLLRVLLIPEIELRRIVDDYDPTKSVEIFGECKKDKRFSKYVKGKFGYTGIIKNNYSYYNKFNEILEIIINVLHYKLEDFKKEIEYLENSSSSTHFTVEKIRKFFNNFMTPENIIGDKNKIVKNGKVYYKYLLKKLRYQHLEITLETIKKTLNIIVPETPPTPSDPPPRLNFRPLFNRL